MPTREEAWELLCEYTKGDSLRKHALSVETAMRACAQRYGGLEADKDEWGMVGLLHDFDYEMFPSADQHRSPARIFCAAEAIPTELFARSWVTQLYGRAARHRHGQGAVCH
jgi:predicted hydrolase (HD superfamily)